MRITACSELTIDGRMTLGRGASSKQLFDFYGPELRSWFHSERTAHDAIMVGAGTVRSDNPELTVRHAAGNNPIRVIPTNDGNLPDDCHLLNDGITTLLGVPNQNYERITALMAARPHIKLVRCGETSVDIAQLIKGLEILGIASLLVEGGSHLLHSLYAANLIDRIIIKHIPVISGAVDAPAYLANESRLPLSRWQVTDWCLIGGIGVGIYERPKGAN